MRARPTRSSRGVPFDLVQTLGERVLHPLLVLVLVVLWSSGLASANSHPAPPADPPMPDPCRPAPVLPFCP